MSFVILEVISNPDILMTCNSIFLSDADCPTLINKVTLLLLVIQGLEMPEQLTANGTISVTRGKRVL